MDSKRDIALAVFPGSTLSHKAGRLTQAGGSGPVTEFVWNAVTLYSSSTKLKMNTLLDGHSCLEGSPVVLRLGS